MNLLMKVLKNSVAKKCQDNNRNDNNKQTTTITTEKNAKTVKRQEHDYILPYDFNKSGKIKVCEKALKTIDKRKLYFIYSIIIIKGSVILVKLLQTEKEVLSCQKDNILLKRKYSFQRKCRNNVVKGRLCD